MAGKSKVKDDEPRNVVSVEHGPEDNPDDSVARTVTRPTVQAARVMQRFGGKSLEINALVRELSGQVAAVNRGDMSRGEAMLTAQAHTLDELFSHLACRAHANMEGGYLDASDRCMRLALKAQSQCRTTWETLAEIKNPRPVAFVKQANFATGPQQVNNGVSRPERAGAHAGGKSDKRPNELLEQQHGERLDTGTAGTAGRGDLALAALERINGTQDGARQG